MKKNFLLFLFLPMISYGQTLVNDKVSKEYYVTAKGGLNVREAPNSKAKKVGILNYGENVIVESRTEIKLSINDTDKETGIEKKIEGEWVSIISEDNVSGYVFDGFLSQYFSSFIERNDGATWTNGFSNYTFSKNMPEYYIDLSSCDPCDIPSTECEMCGYSWMKVDKDSFSFGRKFQNDFFYEEDKTQFYRKNNTIWSINSRLGYNVDYKTDKIYWIPLSSDAAEIEKIRNKNKPILDFIKLKQKEENEAIEKDFL